MKLKELSIEGFKCFKEKTSINFDKMTCFVGTNGVGKTAALEALCKLFGDTQTLRTINKSDFYLSPNSSYEDLEKRELTISATFSYPELYSEGASLDLLPLVFKNLSYEKEDGKLYSTIELTAIWEKNSTSDGNIETSLNWVLADTRQKLTARDKGLIKLHYIPAIRNPEKEIKIISGTVLKRILDYIAWDEELKTTIQEQSEKLQNDVKNVEGIKKITEEMTSFWQEFTAAQSYKTLEIIPSESDINNFMKHLVVQLVESSNNKISIDQLSDGNKSLFYLSLLTTLYSIESKLKKTEPIPGFNNTYSDDSYLTIFALEEPESHLAPHYLSRILSVFNKLCKETNSQTILTSHSPSILKRIIPEQIRHFRIENERIFINNIKLPKDDIIAFKYVKEAVQSHPELYFSKLVILGEGDSEEYIIPRLAELQDVNLDKNFTAFVPLSGRFTNHFWKLLEDLNIPYVTLLDFDLGRNTGGNDKITYVKNQLLAINKISEPEKEILEDPSGTLFGKLELLEQKDVFFSYPIDIDYLMLSNYFDEYTTNTEILGKARLPKPDDKKLKEKNLGAVSSVLKKDINEFDLQSLPEELNINDNFTLYYWYRHLFLGEGKPITHKIAFTKIEESYNNGSTGITVLQNLFTRIKGLLNA